MAKVQIKYYIFQVSRHETTGENMFWNSNEVGCMLHVLYRGAEPVIDPS